MARSSVGSPPITLPTFPKSTPSIGGCSSAESVDASQPLIPAERTPIAANSATSILFTQPASVATTTSSGAAAALQQLEADLCARRVDDVLQFRQLSGRQHAHERRVRIDAVVGIRDLLLGHRVREADVHRREDSAMDREEMRDEDDRRAIA